MPLTQQVAHNTGAGRLEHPESLGLDLVVNLARQLGGTIEFATREGTEFHVRFCGSRNHGNNHQR